VEFKTVKVLFLLVEVSRYCSNNSDLVWIVCNLKYKIVLIEVNWVLVLLRIQSFRWLEFSVWFHNLDNTEIIGYSGLIYAIVLAIEGVNACFDCYNIETHKYQHAYMLKT